jgi:hypothetical protein
VKKLLYIWAIMLGTLPALALGQTTTYTGIIKDLSLNVVTSGQVTFTLSAPVDSTLPGIGRFTPTTVNCNINADGSLSGYVAGLVSGACIVASNTAISPSGTAYRICIQPYNLAPGSCFYDYAVTASKDITTVTPTLQTGPLNYNGVPGPPLNVTGIWSSTYTYHVGDVAVSAGITYLSLAGSNLNNAPASSPTFWSNLFNYGPSFALPTINGTTHTNGLSLAAAIAATPAGGELYVDPGVYPVSNYITRTTTIHIVCDPAATIQSDGYVFSITGHGADGTSVDGCNWSNVSTQQVCAAPPAATFSVSTCTGAFITIARFPGDTVGYEATSTDADVWPSMTTTQKTNSTIGATIAFTDVNNIRVSRNRGGRVRFYAAYTLSGSPNGGNRIDFLDNNIICGGATGAYGCLTVAGDGSTFTPSAGVTITGVHINRNTASHNGPSGAITIANTTGADIGDNISSYNGEAEFKTYQPFSTWGSIGFNVHDNDFSYGAGGCADLQPDYPTTTDEETQGKFVHNTCRNNGIVAQNGGGLNDTGGNDIIADNQFIANTCYGILAGGTNQHVIGNTLRLNGNSSCISQYSLAIQPQFAAPGMIVAFNTIQDSTFSTCGPTSGTCSIVEAPTTDPVIFIGNITTGSMWIVGNAAGNIPALELMDVDANGPRPVIGTPPSFRTGLVPFYDTGNANGLQIGPLVGGGGYGAIYGTGVTPSGINYALAANNAMTILGAPSGGSVGVQIGGGAMLMKCTVAAGCAFSGAVSAGGGANVVYRCTTAGALPVGALTTTSTGCGASVATSFQVN